MKVRFSVEIEAEGHSTTGAIRTIHDITLMDAERIDMAIQRALNDIIGAVVRTNKLSPLEDKK